MAMPDLHKIYDRRFFEDWGPRNKDYVDSARMIVDTLCEELKPKKIVDFGCGCGVYTHFFQGRGVQVTAIDGVTPPIEECYPVQIELRDITEPFMNKWGAFDFALCLEVAEHIPEKMCDAMPF